MQCECGNEWRIEPAGRFASPPDPTSANRTVYTVLGLFLGGFGIHNFIAGEVYAGLGKIILLGVYIGFMVGWGIDGLVGAYAAAMLSAVWIGVDLLRGPRKR